MHCVSQECMRFKCRLEACIEGWQADIAACHNPSHREDQVSQLQDQNSRPGTIRESGPVLEAAGTFPHAYLPCYPCPSLCFVLAQTVSGAAPLPRVEGSGICTNRGNSVCHSRLSSIRGAPNLCCDVFGVTKAGSSNSRSSLGGTILLSWKECAAKFEDVVASNNLQRLVGSMASQDCTCSQLCTACQTLQMTHTSESRQAGTNHASATPHIFAFVLHAAHNFLNQDGTLAKGCCPDMVRRCCCVNFLLASADYKSLGTAWLTSEGAHFCSTLHKLLAAPCKARNSLIGPVSLRGPTGSVPL